MFEHHLRDRKFESGAISGLAVIGLDNQSGGWIPAVNYTSILAGMITTLRAVVAYRALMARARSIRHSMRAGRIQRQAEAEAPSVLEGVVAMVDQFMTLAQFHGHPGLFAPTIQCGDGPLYVICINGVHQGPGLADKDEKFVLLATVIWNSKWSGPDWYDFDDYCKMELLVRTDKPGSSMKIHL